MQSGHIITAGFVQDGTQDSSPPSAPSQLQATRGNALISLSWRRSTDNVGVVGYEVEYSLGSGFQNSRRVRVGNVRTARIEGLVRGVRYYFRVRAFDAAENVSAPSLRVSARPL